MSTVYHATSLFQPTSEATHEQFDARINLIGRRLERFIHARFWYLTNSEDDLDDAVQGALVRLWKMYEKEPWIMDMGDGWWIKVGLRAANNTLKALRAQHGITRVQGVEQMELRASRIQREDDERDWLEVVEMKHARVTTQSHRAESDQADKRIDLEWVIEQAIDLIAPQHRQPVRTLIPYISQGYHLCEAARHCGMSRSKAEHAWKALQEAACEIAGTTRDPLKGKGTAARPDEYEAIRTLAAQGVSLSNIASQLGRDKQFVVQHFEAATGYQRGANNQRNPMTPERVTEMKQLRAQDFSMAAIAKAVHCSVGSVHTWLTR